MDKDETSTPSNPGISAFCPKCAYDLRATATDRCPECGQDLTGLRNPTPIPWENRRQIGRLRAYFQTAWMVRAHPGRFCENVARPVSYPDAQAFRWTTIAVAYLLVLLGTILVYVFFPPPADPAMPVWHEQAYAEVWPVILLHVGLLLFLIAATGVPSYLFHPKRAPMQQQNAAVALSYYTCSPLVYCVFAVLPLVTGLYYLAMDVAVSVSFAWPGALVGLVIALLWWVSLVRLAGRGLPQIRGRKVVVGLCTPVLWLLVATVTLVLVPAGIFVIMVVIASLG
ncbi:MAG: hypothetical protein ACE5GE_14290, partial [Phycisphaerae bacterium]